MPNRLVLIVLLVFCLLSQGCGVVGIALYARRQAVKNDYVYVKENNTLYKRYIKQGLMYKGNKELLDAVSSSITYSNEDVIVFKSYEDFLKRKDELRLNDVVIKESEVCQL